MSKATNPVAYTADAAVYVDGTLFKAGETFVTAATKGSTWNEVTPREKAAADAGKQIHDDVDYSKLKGPALLATAAALGLNVPAGASDADVRAIIAARDEPTL